MEKGQIFDIEIDGVLTSAELLDIVDYNDASYAVYSVEINSDANNLYVSKVIKDANGNDELVDVEDEEVKSYILNIVNEAING
ncbi:MAG: DUF1292 domain-containing protein [Erysipelotrichales bacterium]|nr:DUF1292 domain-containing protein [Erysipelotrichales bacterium]